MRAMSRSILPLLTSLILLALAAPATPAQCVLEGAGILNARYAQGEKVINVSLSKPVTESDLRNTGLANQWRLEDISVSPPASIPITETQLDNAGNLPQVVSVILRLKSPLDINHLYRLAATTLTFQDTATMKDGCRPSDTDLPTEALLKIRKKGQVGALPPRTNYFPMSKSDGRDDSNVYVMTSIEGARNTDPTFAVDLKVEVPFSINQRAGKTSDQVIDIVPYFDLKTSSAGNGDADSMSFGGRFRIPFNISQANHPSLFKALRYVRWDPGAGFESDRRFRNVNVLVNNRLTFGIPGNRHTFTWRVRLLPFIGLEAGRNVRSPVEEARDRTLVRPYFGSALYLNFDRPNDRSLSFQADYTRRFLLNREFSFEEMEDANKNKVLVPVAVGKGPRDYFKGTAEYDFSKFTGFTFSYEYGRLPPNFEKVDHKYSFGFVYKFSTKFVPK